MIVLQVPGNRTEWVPAPWSARVLNHRSHNTDKPPSPRSKKQVCETHATPPPPPCSRPCCTASAAMFLVCLRRSVHSAGVAGVHAVQCTHGGPAGAGLLGLGAAGHGLRARETGQWDGHAVGVGAGRRRAAERHEGRGAPGHVRAAAHDGAGAQDGHHSGI